MITAATFDHIRSIHGPVFDSSTYFSGSFQSENLSKSINSLENLLNAKVCWFLNSLVSVCKIFFLGIIEDSLYVNPCHCVDLSDTEVEIKVLIMLGSSRPKILVPDNSIDANLKQNIFLMVEIRPDGLTLGLLFEQCFNIFFFFT